MQLRAQEADAEPCCREAHTHLGPLGGPRATCPSFCFLSFCGPRGPSLDLPSHSALSKPAPGSQPDTISSLWHFPWLSQSPQTLTGRALPSPPHHHSSLSAQVSSNQQMRLCRHYTGPWRPKLMQSQDLPDLRTTLNKCLADGKCH